MNELNNKHGSYRTIAFFACSLAFIVSLFSCNSDRVGRFEHPGMLQMSVTADTSGINYNEPTTKADISSDLKPLLNTDLYKVEILQGAENTVIQTFDHYKDMPDLVELERGDYKIRASMGELKPATFDSPCTEGTSDFIIKEDMTTKLNITCALINARVTVAYTDSFKMVYPKHKTEIKTSYTTAPFEFAQSETRAGWFQVKAEGEELTCILTAQQDTGAVKQFSVRIPAVKPKDDVSLTFNSSQENRPEKPDRGLTVKITINKETIEKPVYVYVPDYMLPVEGVSVELKEFASGVPQPIKKGITVNNYSVDIAAPGTIGKCLLSIAKKGGEPKRYDLANLSEADKATLTNDEALVWDNMNAVEGRRVKRASINFKKLVEKLQTQIPDEGIDLYDYTLVVSDSLKVPHTSEPKILKIKVYPDNAPLLTSVNFMNSIKQEFMEKDASKDYKVNIKVPNGMEKCMLTIYQDGKQVGSPYNLMESVPEGTVFGTISDTEYEVSFKNAIPTLKAGIDTPIQYEYSLVVTDKFPDEPFVSDPMVLSLKVNPYIKVYAPRGDTWTNRAKIVMELANNVTLPTTFEYRDENSSWTPILGTVQKEGTKAFVPLTGLTDNKKYLIRAKYNDKVQSEEAEFTTEEAKQLPNAGFEEWSEKKVVEANGWGGKDIYAFYPYNAENVNPSWNTNNHTTTQVKAATWYYAMFPGTVCTAKKDWTSTNHLNTHDKQSFVIESHNGNNAMEITTVGWGNNSWTNGNKHVEYKTHGSLYLGSYDQDTHSEKFGIIFPSRPLQVQFYYKYHSYNSESTAPYAEVIDADGNQIGYGLLRINATTKTFVKGIINIVYSNTTAKAASFRIVFLSTDASSPSVKSVQGGVGALGGYADSRHIGSILTIDDVELIYE